MTNTETCNEWRPPVGGRYLAPSGRIWTVRSITSRGSRVVMASDSPEGEHGAVVDVTAVSRMIALDEASSARPAALVLAGQFRTPRPGPQSTHAQMPPKRRMTLAAAVMSESLLSCTVGDEWPISYLDGDGHGSAANSMTSRPRVPPASSRAWASPARSGG